jgi:hypothetical protein
MTLTGEDIRDLAAILRRLLDETKFKVAGADGRGTQDNLNRALGWMREFNRRGEARIMIANISVGAYNRKWLVLGCDGTLT